jgi:hypothetical protein
MTNDYLLNLGYALSSFCAILLTKKNGRKRTIPMGHKIAEAIIENGQIRQINRKLPRKKMKVHLIYDDVGKKVPKTEVARILGESCGIYRDVDVEAESRRLRKSWERNVYNVLPIGDKSPGRG